MHKQRLKQFRQRRRVVIPFQPSPDVIDHTYYPPDVYLRYTFVFTIPGNEASSSLSAAVPKRQEESHREHPKSLQADDDSIIVKGYKPWKKNESQSKQEIREQALPASFRKRVC